jgi:hypothetical protein
MNADAQLAMRVAWSALIVAANCAASLSENGALGPQKAMGIADELKQVAKLLESAHEIVRGGDALPAESAVLLHTLAHKLEGRATGTGAGS